MTVLLLVDKGRPVARIAEDLGLNEETVYRYVHFYHLHGLARYLAADPARYRGLLTSAQLAHPCQKVTAWLVDKPIHQVFLPPYLPNLNLIERLWKCSRHAPGLLRSAFAPARPHRAREARRLRAARRHRGHLRQPGPLARATPALSGAGCALRGLAHAGLTLAADLLRGGTGRRSGFAARFRAPDSGASRRAAGNRPAGIRLRRKASKRFPAGIRLRRKAAGKRLAGIRLRRKAFKRFPAGIRLRRRVAGEFPPNFQR